MRFPICLLIVLMLSGCAANMDGASGYNPNRCDRSGDESQRRAC